VTARLRPIVLTFKRPYQRRGELVISPRAVSGERLFHLIASASSSQDVSRNVTPGHRKRSARRARCAFVKSTRLPCAKSWRTDATTKTLSTVLGARIPKARARATFGLNDKKRNSRGISPLKAPLTRR
jgi:hypothetical protein